ncbi:MAG: sugar phosphorylase [Candidatus Promineifilaceae bacterium]|nr:sugar phosphorylase [Candidatus Promineifilaceae bacterium]
MKRRLIDRLAFLYGEEQADSLASKIEKMLADFTLRYPDLSGKGAVNRVDERDSVLITYGDMVHEEGATPLQSVADFLSETVSETISTVHLLPFYPYSSDDGFSVIDYQTVDPRLGDWSDVAQIGRNFRLMFDAVVNHISVQSSWFQGFLGDDPRYRNFFTVVDSSADLSQVFRPRALPLLTEVDTASGRKQVWTTFSADQVDLNYAEPDVLLAVIDTLLFYVGHGAEFIRLDAIAFIWKEYGTTSIHLPQTHEIIRLMRTVLDMVAPRVALITETNVPHVDNISYFGDGHNEAQMVYNFSLPPLTLHAFHTGSAETLSQWAKELTLPSDQTTFFNFLASHDGIGLTPARGLLAEEEVQSIADRVEALGGYVSYKANADGTESAYELNINFLDALGDPEEPQENIELQARRFVASQAVMLALRGVPGIYFHSLFGSRNWTKGVEKTGRSRSINREKLSVGPLRQELADPGSLRFEVFSRYSRLLDVRRAEPAFHPNGEQMVLDLNPSLFAVKRVSTDGRSSIYCLQNVSGSRVETWLPLRNLTLHNIIDGAVVNSNRIEMNPYAVLWLKP